MSGGKDTISSIEGTSCQDLRLITCTSLINKLNVFRIPCVQSLHYIMHVYIYIYIYMHNIPYIYIYIGMYVYLLLMEIKWLWENPNTSKSERPCVVSRGDILRSYIIQTEGGGRFRRNRRHLRPRSFKARNILHTPYPMAIKHGEPEMEDRCTKVRGN